MAVVNKVVQRNYRQTQNVVVTATHWKGPGFFLRFRFGDRKEILRDRLEEFERPFWSLKTP